MFHNDAKVLERLDRIEKSYDTTKNLVTEIMNLLKSIHLPGPPKPPNGEKKETNSAFISFPSKLECEPCCVQTTSFIDYSTEAGILLVCTSVQ